MKRCDKCGAEVYPSCLKTDCDKGEIDCLRASLEALRQEVEMLKARAVPFTPYVPIQPFPNPWHVPGHEPFKITYWTDSTRTALSISNPYANCAAACIPLQGYAPMSTNATLTD